MRQLWAQCVAILNRPASAFSSSAGGTQSEGTAGGDFEDEDELDEIEDADEQELDDEGYGGGSGGGTEAGGQAWRRKETRMVRRAAARRARLAALATMGRLLVSGCLSPRHFRWLGINIVSNVSRCCVYTWGGCMYVCTKGREGFRVLD